MKKILLLAVTLIMACSPVLAGGLAIGTAAGFPTVKLGVGDNLAVDLGLQYTSLAAGTATTAYLAKLTMNLAKAGEVQTDAGVYYASNGAASATTQIGLTYGVSAMIESNLSVGLDFVAVSTSVGGAAFSTVLPAIALKGAFYL